MSARRGRNSENSAAAVKNTVWESAMLVDDVASSRSMVVSAGDSMEAFSWKAKMATSKATISDAMERP